MLALQNTGFGAAPRPFGVRRMTCCCNNACTHTDETCCFSSFARTATGRRMTMGLGADGALMQATITQTVAERVQAIRNKMVTLGVPIAVGSGAITMLTFAAAFGLARTERVWAPALWLGAMTTVGGLITAAVAAKTAADEAKKQAETPTTVTPPVAPVAPVTPVTPAPTPDSVSTFGYYGGYGYY